MPVDLDKVVKEAKQTGYIEACYDINKLANQQILTCTVDNRQAAGAIVAMMKAVLALSKMKLREMQNGKGA